MTSKTIIFIHGMFNGANAWDAWIEYFEQAGFTCLAPAWPFHDPADDITNLGALTLDTVIARYQSIIRELPEPPILIGHSMGGLIVQVLLNQGLGLCGIAIDSAPPAGVSSLAWSFLKSNLPVINPFMGDTPYVMSFPTFQYVFAHLLPLEEQMELYKKMIVPESRNVARSAGKFGKIDFTKPHSPLLLIAGEQDHIIPASLNKKNFLKYKPDGSVAQFKIFPERTHSITAQHDWREVAEYILNWIKQS